VEYSDLIVELRQLVDRGDALLRENVTHEAPRFRKWRHEAESVVGSATGSGLTLPGEFRSSRRVYRAMWSGAAENDDIAALRDELRDSLIELRFIIDQYDKYGAPKAPKSSARTLVSLAVPERVTLAWLARNVSVGQWVTVAFFVLMVFIIGVNVGRTEAYRKLEAFVTSIIPAR